MAQEVTPYEEALEALYSLVSERSLANTSNKGDPSDLRRFDLLYAYVKMLELEEAISEMKIIHVAGTKGKGSTCTFTESILHHCGFRTGLFTSPHLIDIRERFRLDGADISKEKFLAYFWWCYDRLKEKSTDDIPMPPLFRFLALLAFKIFAAEQIKTPVVCCISALGYDHMEILGNTLGEISGEKAGIFKHGVPAFTVSQPEEAMRVLEEKAAKLDVPLGVAPPLDASLLNGLKLGLEGEHQYINAGLAIALSSTWLQRTGHFEISYLEQTSPLPEQFIKGLTTASLQGRAQIVPDRSLNIETCGEMVFYLDGTHSPESMEVCGRWFSVAIQEDYQPSMLNFQPLDNSGVSHEFSQKHHLERSRQKTSKILLFNCMSVRDPQLLLSSLMKTCASHGVHFKKALFVPNTSMYRKAGHALPPADSQVDLSWQFTLQRVWESLLQGDKERKAKKIDAGFEKVKQDMEMSGRSSENSAVFSSLPLAIKWLRDSVQQNQSVRFQVLVTGSLYLVGDVLRLVKE